MLRSFEPETLAYPKPAWYDVDIGAAYGLRGIAHDLEAKKVTVDGEEVRLTATEYKIIEYLMINMDKTLSSNQIYENVWNENAFSTEKTVTVHIRRIREKIEIDTKNPKYIKVVWGIGYRIEKI